MDLKRQRTEALPNSSVMTRLMNFLPQLAEANEQLGTLGQATQLDQDLEICASEGGSEVNTLN
jgi:hypothetical protein